MLEDGDGIEVAVVVLPSRRFTDEKVYTQANWKRALKFVREDNWDWSLDFLWNKCKNV